MGDFSFTDNTVPSAAEWNANVRDQLVVICTSLTRPTAPATGRRIYETDTGLEYVYSGAGWTLFNTSALCGAWTAYTPTWATSGNAPVLSNGVIQGRYRQLGKTVDIVIAMVSGSSTTYGTGGWTFSLPTGMSAYLAYPTGRGTCKPDSNTRPAMVQASGSVLYVYSHTSSTDARLAQITGTAPATWVNQGGLYIQLTLEIA